MHLPAGEAVGSLNKTKWANTTAKERLVILEQLQERLTEEMEDLGQEEAEMKNMKIGTTDNPYAADACRLTSVVPLAFCISSAIDLYKTNIAGKPLGPVRVNKVEPHSGVDMIDFGNKDDTENEEEDDTQQQQQEFEQEADTSHSQIDELFPDNKNNNTQQQQDEDNDKEDNTKDKKKDNDQEDTTKEDKEKSELIVENGDDNTDNNNIPPVTPTAADALPPDELIPSSPPEQQPDVPPPPPPSDSPAKIPDNTPPEPPSDPPPEPPANPPPEPPASPPPEPPQTTQEEEAAEKDGEADQSTTEEINGDDKQHDNADTTKENGTGNDDTVPSTTEEPDTTTTINDEKNDKDATVENGDTAETEPPPSSTEATTTTTNDEVEEGKKIKIMFEEGDEFAMLDPDGKPPAVFHDALISPRTWNEKGYFNSRQERLRFRIIQQPPQDEAEAVERDPNNEDGRVGPYDRRDPKATAILGASCYSAAPEIIKATFFDGHVVVYKPHPYNVDVDRIWAEVLKPLVEIGAVSYCKADEGPELVKDPRIDQIYMTGTAETGREVLQAANSSDTTNNKKKTCVLQTGSVNPVILVPGLNRQWKAKEMRHHALQIASAGKFNGGHFCGRPQVIVTSKSWDQREAFLEELEKAIAERTPPEGSYDPKYRREFNRFVREYPENSKIIEAEGLTTDSARVLLVTGAAEDSYGLQHEAFCQVLIEVALDIPDHPVAYLPEAVKFCNEKLYGSLCATIVVDDVVNKKYSGIVHQALTDLNYGTVATNAMACFAWFNPGMYWGNYKFDDDDEECEAKGVGHFGNLMGYHESAVKSVITDCFTGNGHWIKTCRGAYAEKIASLSHYALEPSWKKVSAYKYKGVRAAAARKDW
ncbi:Aldehyde dehydrogenase family [Seminavis robusta]|uniref:Aldehyde dehydrogenase family n=1 Tax=Seminavis robusta TaxID=568900 RepID=A0A9N8EWP0_9STRA|nr:Aldehyde dehydrogenase family [Seminavis robusta]|eukprot:Sro1982_g309190.1 Aldehyde dehydrogenase family (874) ;mRNA; f:6298-8919